MLLKTRQTGISCLAFLYVRQLVGDIVILQDVSDMFDGSIGRREL